LGFSLPEKNVVLPLGISFFIFQAMSYVFDVYRNTTAVQFSFGKLGLYIAFFPQLIAGPIVRYRTVAGQIEHRKENPDDFSIGVKRFLMGLGKKMLLANNMALIADKAFSLPDAERSVVFAWFGSLAYSFQIFFDFSGYSDMAIGLGRMFGFRFLENFNYPYMAYSISDFWRRWHISLGEWFRDYVYFPLGGSRVVKKSRLVLNLFVVWGLTGIWHGAQWSFIFWGGWYFLLIAFEKCTGYPTKIKNAVGKAFYRVFTLFCVLLGWVLFRAPGARAAYRYGLSMLNLSGNSFFCVNTIASFREYWLFFLMSILCSTPLFERFRVRFISSPQPINWIINTAVTGFYLFIFFWSVSFIVLGTHNPFLYFNF
jgi:alginate O-acetyltransferase complex protein AlgI